VTDADTAGRSGLPAEISNSLAMVWKRYAGQRPVDVETVVHGTKIACVLRDSVRGFDEAMAAIAAGELDDEGKALPVRTISGYKREAVEAVAKVTRERVLAFVSDHDTDSDIAREVFILDRPPRRRASIFLERRPADPRTQARGAR
jgi:uncharacterized protein YbcI